MMFKSLPGYFLIACLLIVMYLMFKLFQPFLTVLFLAGVIATITYPIYENILEKVKNRSGLASFVMSMLVLLVLVLPFIQLGAVFATKSVDAYRMLEDSLQGGVLEQLKLDNLLNSISAVPYAGENLDQVKDVLISVGASLNSTILWLTSSFIKGTAEFFISLVFFIFSLYYLYKDGKLFLSKMMHWTPLSNKYDKVIFEKFSEMSRSTIISTFVVAIVQGFVAGLGYFFVGLPAFFLGVASGFAALLPMLGAALIWFPAGVILLLLGDIWQGLFILGYGAGVVSLVDNLVRPFMIQGKTNVHPLLIFFSILGGISYMGTLGFLFGPLILTIFLTFLHIYEMEYDSILER